jgi:hypothetical protein
VKVAVYPADVFGCGYHRLIWPAEELRRQGYDVDVMLPGTRDVELSIDTRTGEVVKMQVPDADVVVFQRTSHRYVVAMITALQKRGVAVVVDVDDNLNEIHPKNPAWRMLHPSNEGRTLEDGTVHLQSWTNVARACRLATLVTVSTPALVPVYGRPGATQVLYNRLAAPYFKTTRVDSDVVGWPASYHSHPDDPYVTRDAVARVVRDGGTFRVLGDPTGAGRAFKLDGGDPPREDQVDILGWPARVATLGVGVAPAAPTIFNQSKSWLKPLEMSAVGVPWVASPTVEYERLFDMGAGRLARTPDEWYDELTRLRTDAAWRAELSETGRAVAALHRLEDHAWRWWEAWGRAYRLRRGVRAARRSVV